MANSDKSNRGRQSGLKTNGSWALVWKLWALVLRTQQTVAH